VPHAVLRERERRSVVANPRRHRGKVHFRSTQKGSRLYGIEQRNRNLLRNPILKGPKEHYRCIRLGFLAIATLAVVGLDFMGVTVAAPEAAQEIIGSLLNDRCRRFLIRYLAPWKTGKS
jgi:hypothetical protein